MGCNYYVRYSSCPHCGLRKPDQHVGKSSYGWKFLFYTDSESLPRTAKEWRTRISDTLSAGVAHIVDEYEERIEANHFWELVEANQSAKRSHTDEDDKYGYTDADGYDFCTMEFS